MATLSATELAELRQGFADGRVVAHTKPQINAVLQAVEDWFEANRASLGAAMEAAAPGVFTGPQKKAIGSYWLRQKFVRGG